MLNDQACQVYVGLHEEVPFHAKIEIIFSSTAASSFGVFSQKQQGLLPDGEKKNLNAQQKTEIKAPYMPRQTSTATLLSKSMLKNPTI